MTDNPHTAKQRKSLHLWCEMMGVSLNDAGLTRRIVLEELVHRGFEGDWDKMAVKEIIWKPVQEVLLGFESTEDNSTVSYDVVYKHLVRHFATAHGMQVPPWPDRFTQGRKI